MVHGIVYCLEYYYDSTLSQHDQVVAALQQLAGDRDTDVREAAAKCNRVQATPPAPPTAQAEAERGEEEGREKEGGEEGGQEGGSSGSDPPSWAQIAAK